ncbi:putative ribonuclease H-like domain-containing protein [Tanacetum coccineum]
MCTIRSDNGTEFKNRDVIEFLWLKGIQRNTVIPELHKQNGVAERKNRPLLSFKDQCMQIHFYLNTFRPEAVSTEACYVQIGSENQANLHSGQQEANQNAGTEEIINAGDSDKEDESAQDCFVLPIWPSYSSTNTPALTTDDKREGPREEEQVPKGQTQNMGPLPPRVSFICDLEYFSDSDYAGANLDRKSTRVYHSKTKHIAIRHHFIRDAYEKKLIQVLKIHTDDNVADLLTKAFDVSSKMAVLDSCPKHNMVAYLEKSEGNVEFHEIIDFLKRSSIHHALTHQPDPYPNLPTTTIPELSPELLGESLESFIQVINPSGKERFPKKELLKETYVHKESEPNKGRKFAKVDHMETENAQNEGRTREMVDEDKEIDGNTLCTEDVLSTDKDGVSTDMEKVSTDRPIVSTDGSKVSTEGLNKGAEEQVEGAEEQVKGTDEHKEGTEEHNESTEEQREGTEEKVESTDGQIKGTEDQTEEEIATQATQTSTQTPTSKIFGDDETIAKVLLNMSQAKAVSREKEKGVELKES